MRHSAGATLIRLVLIVKQLPPAVPPDSHRYLLPVSDLVLTGDWSIGCVLLRPQGSTRPLIAQSREARAEQAPHRYDQHLDQGLAARLDESTVAEVACAEPGEAYEHVADALAVLRLLQHERAPMVDTDWQTFGLPGQVAKWQVDFIDLATGPAEGFFRGGAVPGWTFSEDDHDAFQADAGLQFLSRALAKRRRTRVEQRAILAARLLSTSTLEQDPDQKLLAAVMALEVLLGDDSDMRDGPKKFRLARRYAYLACSVPTHSMCGRDRASCAYLALNPDDKTPRRALIALLDRAKSDARVRCSAYLSVIDWYDARSRAAHDGTVGADLKAVRNVLYPLYRWFVPQVYRWYAAHGDDDRHHIDEAIDLAVQERPPEAIEEG
jgi:hypothetical protein